MAHFPAACRADHRFARLRQAMETKRRTGKMGAARMALGGLNSHAAGKGTHKFRRQLACRCFSLDKTQNGNDDKKKGKQELRFVKDRQVLKGVAQVDGCEFGCRHIANAGGRGYHNQT
jgi:hypothetical protein